MNKSLIFWRFVPLMFNTYSSEFFDGQSSSETFFLFEAKLLDFFLMFSISSNFTLEINTFFGKYGGYRHPVLSKTKNIQTWH